MKLFADANILVSVINHEYPLYNYAARILSLANTKNFEIYTSPLNLAIAFYFAQKKCKAQRAKQKIEIIQKHLQITEMNATIVGLALQNKQVQDFEDGLQYYSALNSNCDCILTEDVGDYYYSDIEVISSKDFMLKYLLQ
jgi:predicted nucleic acid-binding protein